LLDDTNQLTPSSSIAYNETVDRIAVGYLNGLVKIYNVGHFHCSYQHMFNQEVHNLDWTSDLLLISQPDRLVVFDFEQKSINSVLTWNQQKEYFSDCIWKPFSTNIVVGRNKNRLLVWDIRSGREPVKVFQLGQIGTFQKLKFSHIPNSNLLSAYDSKLEKIKIYDFRFMVICQVESFETSSFLDYQWVVDKSAIVVATHRDELHWIDIDYSLDNLEIKIK